MSRLGRTSIVLLVVWTLVSAVPIQAEEAPSPAIDRQAARDLLDHAPSLPGDGGHFTENLGQWESHVRFVASTAHGQAVFHRDGVMHHVAVGDGVHRVKVAFSEAGPVEPSGVGDVGFPTNFFLGNDPASWVTGARSYRELLYRDVWPGVDARYHFSGGALKYDIIVGADADPSIVGFVVEGSEGLEVMNDRLDILLPGGSSLQDRDLVAYYADGKAVDAAFQTSGDTYGFSVEKERGRELVIDPLILPASTYLGGSYDDMGADIKQDPKGNIYVAGTTVSPDYPVTSGAYSVDYVDMDLIVTKLDRNCSEVLWSTFIGGSGEDLLTGIELDAESNVHVLGETQSVDFPTTEGVFQETISHKYSKDLYILKLCADGSALDYSTFLGGLYGEVAGDIKVHNGRAYVAGMTESPDFPAGNISAWFYKGIVFLIVLSEDGTRVDSVMSWGGTRTSQPSAIHVDDEGNVTITGMTAAWDFPTTPGAYMEEGNYNFRGFLLQCDPDANVTKYATYFGNASAYPTDIALDGEGNIYLAGSTLKLTGVVGLEITEGAYCTTHKGRSDTFITKMDPQGTSVVYSTLVGGNGDDIPGDLEVTDEGMAVLVGWMRDGAGYEVSQDCLDPVHDGVYEGFIFALNESGADLVHSTFLGGQFYDQATAVEISLDDTLLVTGFTDSKVFPVAEDAYQTDLAGNRDIFISELACLYPPSAPSNLVATGADGSITVEWEPPEDDGGYPMSNYLVLRGTNDDVLVEHVVLENVTTYVDEDVEYGVYYYYAVKAFNGRGLGPSSNVDSARSLTLPDPPRDLRGMVLLDWTWLSWQYPEFTGGVHLTGYHLYRGAEGEHMELLATLDATLMSYSDLQVADGTTYTYEVASVNMVGESRERASVTMRTRAAPTPPRDLDFTYGECFINLTWEAPVDDFDLEVFGYHVYRQTGTGPAERVATITAPTRYFIDRQVDVGTLYTYHVIAENAKGRSDASETLEAMTKVRPDPPTEVTAAAFEFFVRITWSPPSFDGVSPILGYRVYRGPDPSEGIHLGGVDVEAVENPRLVFLHDVPYDSVPRHYYVTAVNAEGESDPSPVVVTKAYDVPGPPQDLEIEWGDGTLTLQWSPPELDGGTPVRLYLLERREASGQEWVLVVTLPEGNLRFVDDTVENGVDYLYRVVASNLAGKGGPSETVSAVPAGPPDAPQGVAAEGLNGSVRISWAPPAWSGGRNIAGYRVYGVSRDLELELLAELVPDAREFTDTGLANGETYLYAVRGFTEAGASELSDVVEGRPVGPPGAVPGLVATWMVDHVHLTWTAPLTDGGSPVTVYMLHRDDWDAGNWTEVAPSELVFQDYGAEHEATYNYTVFAINGEGSGPVARVTFTVPAERKEPPATEDGDEWPYLVAAGLAVMLVGIALLVLRRRPRSDQE